MTSDTTASGSTNGGTTNDEGYVVGMLSDLMKFWGRSEDWVRNYYGLAKETA